MPSHPPIGIVGLGLLGSAIADRLVEEGYDVFGYDTHTPKTDQAFWCPNVSNLFFRAHTIILSLPTSGQVSEVLEKTRAMLKPEHHVIIDTTTSHPDETAAHAQLLAEDGVPYIEASVAGSSELVRRREAVLFLGGDAEPIAAHQALFNALAARSFHLGPAGAAAGFKLVHNLVLGLNRATLAEGLAFAKALGFDPGTTLDVLKQTPAVSGVMETKGQRMIDSDFEDPSAMLSHQLKDLCLILEKASQTGAAIPLSELHLSLLQHLESLGLGEKDNSIIIEAFQHRDPNA